MVFWWNQEQEPAPASMWGSPIVPTMQQYHSHPSNSYIQDPYQYAPHSGDPPSSAYWNEYHNEPEQNYYGQTNADLYVQPYQHMTGSNINNGMYPLPSAHEDINVGAVLAERMRAQQTLNINSFDEEARRRVTICDMKIKKWNERQELQYNQANNYLKWGEERRNADTGPHDHMDNNELSNGRGPRNNGRSNGPSSYNNEARQSGRNDGKKYLESWSDTLREETEMSNRQKKKEFYGMGQAWAREGFFQNLPVAHCPFGLKMLKGMGWRYGQAIGKNKEGHLNPIHVDVRFGRQGLCTKDEKEKMNMTQGRPKPAKKANPVKNINGKHPVSLLAEHCMKRQLTMPKYDVIFEYGNMHSKSVLVSVTVGGRTFEPSQPSPYKKHGKSVAATLALKELEFETGL